MGTQQMSRGSRLRNSGGVEGSQVKGPVWKPPSPEYEMTGAEVWGRRVRILPANGTSPLSNSRIMAHVDET